MGYSGVLAADTMIHEVGHNHGRLHAPCDVNDPDPNYLLYQDTPDDVFNVRVDGSVPLAL